MQIVVAIRVIHSALQLCGDVCYCGEQGSLKRIEALGECRLLWRLGLFIACCSYVATFVIAANRVL